jgi:hypothetical protein
LHCLAAAVFHGLIVNGNPIMKPDQIYQALKELADKLQVTVSEQNLRISTVRARSGLCKIKGKYVFVMDKHKPRISTVRARSGLCKIKGKYVFVMDKHKPVSRKIDLLAECLSQMPHEDVYVVPAVRERLDLYPKA